MLQNQRRVKEESMGGTMMATSLFDSNARVNRGDMSLFAGTVEADEIYIGRQESNKHEEQKFQMGRGVNSVMNVFRLLLIFPIIICTFLIGTIEFASATNHPFTEVKFAGENLNVREKVIKFRDGESAFQRINIEWRYTKNTYNYWGNTRLNDNLVQGETRNTNNLTLHLKLWCMGSLERKPLSK